MRKLECSPFSILLHSKMICRSSVFPSYLNISKILSGTCENQVLKNGVKGIRVASRLEYVTLWIEPARWVPCIHPDYSQAFFRSKFRLELLRESDTQPVRLLLCPEIAKSILSEGFPLTKCESFNFYCWTKTIILWQNIFIFTKILIARSNFFIVDQNFLTYFLTYYFFTNIFIFDQIIISLPKCLFSTQTFYFWPKLLFLTKILLSRPKF